MDFLETDQQRRNPRCSPIDSVEHDSVTIYPVATISADSVITDGSGDEMELT